ncbi:MAG: hypothetical protein AABZ67_16995 [Pseudomonadota bacterium]
MQTLTTQQIAELLAGIARAQQAVIDAIEGQRPGFKGKYLTTTLTTAARIRNTAHTATLADLPARILLAYQSRNPPDVAVVQRDLEALLAAPPAPAAASAPVQDAPAPAASGDSLDMTFS